jgi:hypothetical protein
VVEKGDHYVHEVAASVQAVAHAWQVLGRPLLRTRECSSRTLGYTRGVPIEWALAEYSLCGLLGRGPPRSRSGHDQAKQARARLAVQGARPAASEALPPPRMTHVRARACAHVFACAHRAHVRAPQCAKCAAAQVGFLPWMVPSTETVIKQLGLAHTT